MGGQGDQMGIVQMLDHTSKWYVHNPAAVLENET